MAVNPDAPLVDRVEFRRLNHCKKYYRTKDREMDQEMIDRISALESELAEVKGERDHLLRRIEGGTSMPTADGVELLPHEHVYYINSMGKLKHYAVQILSRQAIREGYSTREAALAAAQEGKA